MSTFYAVMGRVDEIKPNSFSDKIKKDWIDALEGRIVTDVFQLPSAQAEVRRVKGGELEQELLVRFPHDDIYDAWLIARIDFANGEYEKYQNSMEMYNELYENFVQMVAMRLNPAQRTMEERLELLKAYIAGEV